LRLISIMALVATPAMISIHPLTRGHLGLITTGAVPGNTFPGPHGMGKKITAKTYLRHLAAIVMNP
jgi:hypothetical protein